MYRFIIAAVVAGATLAACQPAVTPAELTDEQRAAIVEEVTSLNQEWLRSLEQADFDRSMTLIWDIPGAAWGFAGEIDFGYDAIDAAWRPSVEEIESQEFTVQDLRVEALAPNVVCLNQIVTGITTDTSGVTGPALTFAVTSVWVRRGREWKMQFGHESVLTP
jgi:hypothetical protein